MELTNREWKEFFIGETFKIYSTSSGIDKNKLVNLDGDIPYITRTDKNNGYDMFIGKQNQKYKVDKKNVITIGLDTQTIFYQKSIFYTGQNIQILEFKELNEYNAKFLITLLKQQMTKFNWGGNGATLTRLKKTKILLPVNSHRKPDYAFMESYIQQKEIELLKVYKNHILRLKPSEKVNVEVEWKEFLFPEIFEIKNGFYNKKPISSGNGKIPFLGATANNNGVTGYYTLAEIEENSKIGYGKNEPLERKIFKGNCIAVTNNGSVGYAFYQVSQFTCSHDVNPLYLKNYTLNPFIAKFLITAIEQQRICFEYARKWRPMRMKKSKILLPVNSKGQPDFVYMANYMKALEYEKLKQYLDYKKLNDLKLAK